MPWFLISVAFLFIAIFLHLKSVEHTKLQEKYGKEKGTKLGKIYATISSSEFIFWIGLWISPQPIFIIPTFADSIISVAGISIRTLNLIISLPPILVGAWFGIEGVRETGMELAETHRTPKKILNTGIYSTVRHPQYFGWILAHIGISILLSASYSILFTPVLGALIYLISRKEENELTKEFGKEYEDYKKQVPMLIPKWKIRKLRRQG